MTYNPVDHKMEMGGALLSEYRMIPNSSETAVSINLDFQDLYTTARTQVSGISATWNAYTKDCENLLKKIDAKDIPSISQNSVIDLQKSYRELKSKENSKTTITIFYSKKIKYLIEELRGTWVEEERNKKEFSTRSALAELRRKGGLDWNEVSGLFDVEQDTMDDWISGKPLLNKDKNFLQQCLDLVHYINRGSSRKNRILLGQKIEANKTTLDLMKEREFEKIKRHFGKVTLEEPTALTPLPPISNEAMAARRPLPPSVLAGTISCIAHVESGSRSIIKEAKLRTNKK